MLVLVTVPLAFLLGVLRAQLARAGMANLVVELQRAPDAAELGKVLARTLGDPSLELVYWLRGFDRYVDAAGTQVELPEAGGARAVTRVDHDGEHVAALIHDPALTYEPELLEIVSAATYLALERKRLQDELESQVRELAGSRARLVEAGDAARPARARPPRRRPAAARLARSPAATEDRVATTPSGRPLRRPPGASPSRWTSCASSPAASTPRCSSTGSTWRSTRSPPARGSRCGSSTSCPSGCPAVELAAYFVACEALANVGKYAQASRVTITVSRAGERAVVAIADDGVGGAHAGPGSGLRGLADRVEALGGRLSVRSPEGEGTVITAEMPCEQPAASDDALLGDPATTAQSTTPR